VKFINFARYADLGRIAAAREAHFAYADRLRDEGKLAVGGPLLDDQGTRVGLLFIYEAVSREQARAFARQDPFTLANALATYEITEWRSRAVNVDLLVEANRAARQSGVENPRSRIFANYAKYVVDPARLAAVRPAHWAYDQALERAGRLALAGPMADDEGGLFVYDAASKREAMSYAADDPFAREGVFARHELLEWLINGINPRLLGVDIAAELSPLHSA
jgi:uncharacterized protein